MEERCARGPLAVGGGGGDTGVGGDASRGCLWGELLVLRLGRGLDGWCRLASPQPHRDAHGVPAHCAHQVEPHGLSTGLPLSKLIWWLLGPAGSAKEK